MVDTDFDEASHQPLDSENSEDEDEDANELVEDERADDAGMKRRPKKRPNDIILSITGHSQTGSLEPTKTVSLAKKLQSIVDGGKKFDIMYVLLVISWLLLLQHT